MPQYRLVVCFDIEAEGLQEAYTEMAEKVNTLELAWETSDEWYEFDKEDAGDPDELQKAIVSSFLADKRSKE